MPPRCRDRLAAFLGAALSAADDPRSASLRSGDGRPRFGHGPAARAAWRGLRRGLAIPRPAVTPAASTAGLRVELARLRSLASASAKGLGNHAGLCPAGKAARVGSGGEPCAFLPRRNLCRKVPRPETGRPRHARMDSLTLWIFDFLVLR